MGMTDADSVMTEQQVLDVCVCVCCTGGDAQGEGGGGCGHFPNHMMMLVEGGNDDI